jgi:outer membrane protein
MKKHFAILCLSLYVGSAGFVGCKEKATTTANKTSTTVSDSTKVTNTAATPVADSPVDTAATTPVQTVADKPAATKSQKFGYINSAELLKIMPDAKKADATLNSYVQGLEKQFGTLQTDYKNKITEFQAQEKTMVDAVKQTKIKAITDLEQQMQQSQAAAQQQIAQKREQLFKPILDKAERAIKTVGKENNYDYIFDTSSGSFIYANEGHNVMPLVKSKLNIK